MQTVIACIALLSVSLCESSSRSGLARVCLETSEWVVVDKAYGRADEDGRRTHYSIVPTRARQLVYCAHEGTRCHAAARHSQTCATVYRYVDMPVVLETDVVDVPVKTNLLTNEEMVEYSKRVRQVELPVACACQWSDDERFF